MQVVEVYTINIIDFIKVRLHAGWKVVAMTSYPYNVSNYGTKVECATIVVYEKPDA